MAEQDEGELVEHDRSTVVQEINEAKLASQQTEKQNHLSVVMELVFSKRPHVKALALFLSLLCACVCVCACVRGACVCLDVVLSRADIC